MIVGQPRLDEGISQRQRDQTVGRTTVGQNSAGMV
jgi:hypothetical protein